MKNYSVIRWGRDALVIARDNLVTFFLFMIALAGISIGFQVFIESKIMAILTIFMIVPLICFLFYALKHGLTVTSIKAFSLRDPLLVSLPWLACCIAFVMVMGAEDRRALDWSALQISKRAFAFVMLAYALSFQDFFRFYVAGTRPDDRYSANGVLTKRFSEAKLNGFWSPFFWFISMGVTLGYVFSMLGLDILRIPTITFLLFWAHAAAAEREELLSVQPAELRSSSLQITS